MFKNPLDQWEPRKVRVVGATYSSLSPNSRYNKEQMDKVLINLTGFTSEPKGIMDINKRLSSMGYIIGDSHEDRSFYNQITPPKWATGLSNLAIYEKGSYSYIGEIQVREEVENR